MPPNPDGPHLDSPHLNSLLGQFVGTLADYAVVLLGMDGSILSWNAGAAALKGYAAEEVIGAHFSLFYTPEARMVGHPERELMTAAAVGKFEEHGWRVRKDGTRFWARIIIMPIVDEHGDVRAFGKITSDMTEFKQATEQMANIAALLETTSRTDFLTGLDNRRSLDSLLTATLSAAGRHRRKLVLAMIDLDRFKAFNDEFGHLQGDRYLRSAAGAWRRSLRKEDILARYGGEEFTVVMQDSTLGQAMAGLNAMKDATPPPLTCSIGAAQWDGTETANELISRADRALFAAKAGGRNRIETQPEERWQPAVVSGGEQAGVRFTSATG